MGARFAAPIAWSAFILWPAAGWGGLDGVPLTWTEAIALAFVWWAWAVARELPGTRLLIVLVLAKAVLGPTFVVRGFAARYYANDSWTAPFEGSLDVRSAAFTRLDERLAFGGSGSPDLPLHFFNDTRFNFVGTEAPRRDRLAYSVEWSGYFITDDAVARTFYLDLSRGLLGELAIDGRPVIPLDTGASRSGAAVVGPGWHAVSVRVSAPYGSGRSLNAGEVIAGTRRPFDAGRVLPEPVGPLRLTLDRMLHWVTLVTDMGVLAWLAVIAASCLYTAWRVRRVYHLLWFVAILEAVAMAWRYAGGMVLLTGGDDWLSYETYARAIAFGEVVGAGQNGPFYYQPLYPYFLALTHIGFGDSLFGAVLVQRLFLTVTIMSVAATTRRLFGATAGWIALVGGGGFIYIKIGPWTIFLLNELLFIPLVAAWISLLVKMSKEEESGRRAVMAGILGGTATLARSTLLVAWPPVLLLWVAALRAHRFRLLGILLAAMLAVVSVATIRNWIVADRFVLVASSFSVNLLLGNEPPPSIGPAPPGRAAIYERFGLDDNTRRVTEFAMQAPEAFARGLGQKAWYTLGFFGWSRLPGGIGTSWLYVGAWVFAIVGTVRVLRGSLTRRTPAVWLPAAGAISHFAMVVLVFPYGYTDRLIVPLYPLLIPYAAYGLESLPSLWQRVLPGLQLNMARMRGPLRQSAALTAPLLRQPRDWLHFAYAAAAILGVAWRPGESEDLDLLTALLLPITALAVARLTQPDLASRVVGGALWAAALAYVASGGSRAIHAVNDPIFWGAAALLAFGVSLAVRRWPAGILGSAALAGACTMVALLLPVFSDFDSTFPRLTLAVAEASLSALADQFGMLGALCLLGLWTQALLGIAVRGASSRVGAAAGGALLAALLLTLAGAAPESGTDWRVWLLALGLLLGLIETHSRRSVRGAGSWPERSQRQPG